MGRVYARNVSGRGSLKEGQEVACRVLEVDSGSKGWIDYESILDSGGFIDPSDDRYSFSGDDVDVGDYLVFEYLGGTAFQFVELEEM